MFFNIVDHLHEPPLIVGSDFVVQTGTVCIAHPAVQGSDWQRERVRVGAMELPASFHRHAVHTTATAALGSVGYWPLAGSGAGSGGGWATLMGSTLGSGGAVSVSGYVPVYVSVTTGAAHCGWAVDRVTTEHVGTQVFLLLDLAMLGPGSLMRLNYSLFAAKGNLLGLHEP
jgi:hypothetical protein